MTQEPAPRRNGETLPQLLGERPQTVDHAAPAAAPLLGRTDRAAQPANEPGDVGPEGNIGPIDRKWHNRPMRPGQKPVTGDCGDRSPMAGI